MRRICVSLSFVLLTLLSACSAGNPPSESNTSESGGNGASGTTQSGAGISASSELVDPTHGKQTALAYGAVSGENGVLANGVATARYFQDGSTMITVQANIADAPAGSHYEAWLTGGGLQAVDMGELQSTAGDVRHGLEYTSRSSLQAYDTIVISLQHSGGGSVKGDTVATATLQAPIK